METYLKIERAYKNNKVIQDAKLKEYVLCMFKGSTFINLTIGV